MSRPSMLTVLCSAALDVSRVLISPYAPKLQCPYASRIDAEGCGWSKPIPIRTCTPDIGARSKNWSLSVGNAPRGASATTPSAHRPLIY
ncbi:MAG: hypothetical protein NVV62_10685 [Terricaulis sp.]|nr:hypothetical protein [Terricaulis sp.]